MTVNLVHQVVFSSLWEQIVPFTRDYDLIKAALNKVEEFNKTCLETALTGITSLVMEEWGYSVPCQVVWTVAESALGEAWMAPNSLYFGDEGLHEQLALFVDGDSFGGSMQNS